MRRRWIAAIAVVAAAAIALGVVLAVNIASHPHRQVADLKAILDKIPLPAGTVLTKETATAAQGDAPGDVDRVYRLPPSATSTELVGLLERAGYQFVDPHTGQVDPGQATSGVRTTSGDLRILPPGRSGDGIQFTWGSDRLDVGVQPGMVR